MVSPVSAYDGDQKDIGPLVGPSECVVHFREEMCVFITMTCLHGPFPVAQSSLSRLSGEGFSSLVECTIPCRREPGLTMQPCRSLGQRWKDRQSHTATVSQG